MKKQDVIQYKESMIEQLAQLCSYKSVYTPNENGTPFGMENKKCLEKALEIAESYGFKTVNVDDYCGYIEMGQGEEIIGILAHLDVVPVSDSWNTDPFTLTLIDDRYYARGTSDDKGAAVCSLTAMRALKPLEHTFNKRVRLILGCNEETGSRCIKHYVEKFGHVSYGFTPDGDFPLVFGEKGMIVGLLKLKSDKILDIKGGTVRNTVCAFVKITLKDDSFNKEKLDQFFKEHNINYSLKENILTVDGVAAHASIPQNGVNAISYALEGLYYADINDTAVDIYHNLIGLGYNGQGLEIDLADEYGRLTFNVGICYREDDNLFFSIDIRYPVTLKKETVIDAIEKNAPGMIDILGTTNPLFYSPELPMIRALHKAYVDVTGDTVKQPMVIGGGTYAKSMNNVVAFGCDDGKHSYRIHEDNEFVTWDSLETQVACYYHAILNLMNI
ncbi:MAG TPA: Sapep family Mn(2+)-dependent dipeptidase [Erysipelotrichaceae bacterium]|mgnify:CR=1 FL=1|nr:Sapep family Mn(2+)-dependent dipeptidase [Erysipelotrichaceae bacterium]HQB32690.1 Sapep family Mn(2+)-dependent dipeptidase [Erysipelotrichaceae bacterium]